MHEGGKKAVLAALIANLIIAVAKFIGFAITGAASMLAEAVHSLADSGNQALLLLGGKRAKQLPSEQHPFGYGRERFFWAFVVAMVLFTLGGVVAFYEGIEKLLHPHDVESPMVALIILFVAIIIEYFSFRTAIQVSRPLKGDSTWIEFVRETKIPELSTVLLEDLGAMLGLIFAFVGVGIATLTGDGRYDAIGSIAIGLLLGAIAIVLAKENKSLLIGEAASAGQLAQITNAVEDDPSVSRLIHLRTLHLGPEEVLITAKVHYAGELEFAALADAIDRTEKRIRTAVPEATLIFIEPDEFEPSTV